MQNLLYEICSMKIQQLRYLTEIARRGLARTFQTTKLFTDMSAFENVRLALIYGNPERRFRSEEAEREQVVFSLSKSSGKWQGKLSRGAGRRGRQGEAYGRQ